MKVLSPKQIALLDAQAINKAGIPGIVLMENAALKVVHEISKDFNRLQDLNICVFAGKGNNGGDAFAVARHLFNKGANVKVYLLATINDIQNDAKTNLDIVININNLLKQSENTQTKDTQTKDTQTENAQVKTIELVELFDKESGIIHDGPFKLMEINLNKCDLIIDGIFGTGFKGQVKEPIKGVIDCINSKDKYVLSIDVPSGVNGENGNVEGSCIKAKKTVTFSFPKTGLLVFPGAEFAGELIIVDIGIPKAVNDTLEINTFLVDEELVADLTPKRFDNSNKGSYGKVFVISGSNGMTGSGCLASNAALRAGAGLVYLGVPASLKNIYSSSLIEPIVIPLDDNGTGFIQDTSINDVNAQLEKMDVAVVGPGLSQNNAVFSVVKHILETAKIPLVIDADGLNAVSKDVLMLNLLKKTAVITPHPGEMARLCGVSVNDVQKDRINIARDFSRKFGVVTVLKGARTIIALPDGRVFINPTGNSGMATAGTGDVLAGIIGSFIGQGLKPEEASIAGVYVHGAAGDNAVKTKGRHGLIASDLVNELPVIMNRM